VNVFVYRSSAGNLRSWVIPSTVALQNANQPTAKNKNPGIRDITWAKLNRNPLRAYEGNWQLDEAPRAVNEP